MVTLLLSITRFSQRWNIIKGRGGLSFRVGYASKRFFGDLKTVFIIFLEWIVFGLTEK